MRIRTALAATALAASVVLGGAGTAYADAYAEGKVKRSSGFLSGNLVQIPIHAPINICGNSVNFVGLLNPASGNVCINKDHHGKGHHDKDHHGKDHHGKDHHGKDHHGKDHHGKDHHGKDHHGKDHHGEDHHGE